MQGKRKNTTRIILEIAVGVFSLIRGIATAAKESAKDELSFSTEVESTAEDQGTGKKVGDLIIGIDLGTTTVAAGVFDTDTQSVNVIDFAPEVKYMPSEIFYLVPKKGDNKEKKFYYFVGWEAQERYKENPDGRYLIRCFKRLMGIDSEDHMYKKLFKSPKSGKNVHMNKFLYPIEEEIVEVSREGRDPDESRSEEEKQKKRKLVIGILDMDTKKGQKKWLAKTTPVEESAKLLSEVNKKIEDLYGETRKIQSLVITVPAYFTEEQKIATLRSANMAFEGRDIVGKIVLIPEPVAAALAFVYQQEAKDQEKDEEEDKVYSVFDFGGGTLDCTIVTCSGDGKVLEIDLVTGDNVLGGSDIDDKIEELIRKKLRESMSQEEFTMFINPNNVHSKDLSLLLKRKAEELKIELSNAAHILCEDLIKDGNTYREQLRKHGESLSRSNKQVKTALETIVKNATSASEIDAEIAKLSKTLQEPARTRMSLVKKFGKRAVDMAATIPVLDKRYIYLLYTEIRDKIPPYSFPIYLKKYVPNATQESVSVSITITEMDEQAHAIYMRARECFDELVHPRDSETKEKILSEKMSNIDSVLLIGGSSSIPMMRYILLRDFCLEEQKKGGKETGKRLPSDLSKVSFVVKNGLNTGIDPILAVATGATYRAARHVSAISDGGVALVDSVALSLGIKVGNDQFHILAKRGTRIPCRVEKTFTTMVDHQTMVRIEVAQGEHLLFGDNNPLGQFMLEFGEESRKKLRGEPKINVIFNITQQAITVEAVEVIGGTREDPIVSAKESITIESTKYRPSEEEIKKFSELSEKQRRKNEMCAEIIKARTDVQQICQETVNGLNYVGSSIPKKSVENLKKYLHDLEGWASNVSLDDQDAPALLEFAQREAHQISEAVKKKDISKYEKAKFDAAKYGQMNGEEDSESEEYAEEL